MEVAKRLIEIQKKIGKMSRYKTIFKPSKSANEGLKIANLCLNIYKYSQVGQLSQSDGEQPRRAYSVNALDFRQISVFMEAVSKRSRLLTTFCLADLISYWHQ